MANKVLGEITFKGEPYLIVLKGDEKKIVFERKNPKPTPETPTDLPEVN